jgi:hypothetical protein
MCAQVDITLALVECELVVSSSDCLIPVKVSFDSCAMVGVLVCRSFLEDCGKILPSSVGTLLQCV